MEAVRAIIGRDGPLIKNTYGRPRAFMPTGEDQILKLGESLEDYWISLAPSTASKPEAFVYAWLTLHGYDFVYQYSHRGGRGSGGGGSVIDFVIYIGIRPVALRVQGSYFHSDPVQRFQDEILAQAMYEDGFEVADVWDWELTSVQETDATMKAIIGRVGTPWNNPAGADGDEDLADVSVPVRETTAD